MAGLPPRPDFSDPPSVSRSDSRPHYYGGRPPPPEHYRERERERDVYMSGRSPPRHRHSSRPAADSYVASDRDRDRGTYGPRDAYPPPYDRREHDDRHRERGWDRREYRDYPPPPPPPSHPDYRYREPDPRADPRTWARESRESARPRYEEPRGSVIILGARKSPPRSWTQSDEIDRHPRGARYRDSPREPTRDDGRRWQTRPGLSPPHRYTGNTPPHASSSSQLPRSPRRRSPSPSAKVMSPRRRTSREPLDRRSPDVPYMSRRREEFPPRRDHRSRSRGPRRRSRSRSASPPRRRPPSVSPAQRKETREETLSPGRILEEGEREPSPKRREPPPIIQNRRDVPPHPPSSTYTPRAPAANRPMDIDRRPQERLPTLKVDAPPKSDKPSREPESAKPTSAGSATPQKAESSSRPRSPSLLQQRGITKTPTTPMSPQGRSPAVPPQPALPAKPEWSATPQAEPAAPPVGAATEPVKDELRAIEQKLMLEFGMRTWDPDPLPWQNDEVRRLKTHQLRVEQDYYAASRVARQALYELDIAKLELASTTARRELAIKQTQLALEGKAGIDWPYDYESLNSPVES